MSLLGVTDVSESYEFAGFRLWQYGNDEEKRAAVELSGLLQLTSAGQLVVTVPASLARGVFDAMTEPGISLPADVGGKDSRNILVMTADEVAVSGGPQKITERGKPFRYRLGELVEQPARNWPGVSRCWLLRVISPELSQLRVSYGLSKKPNNDRDDFAIIVACRKLGVLSAGAVSKAITQISTEILPAWLVAKNHPAS
jgi:hypothetical protein